MHTHECPSYKIPHEIDVVLIGCRRHVGLLQIRRHGWVLREFVEQGAQTRHHGEPCGRGFGGQRNGGQAASVFLSGASVGVQAHYCGVKGGGSETELGMGGGWIEGSKVKVCGCEAEGHGGDRSE